VTTRTFTFTVSSGATTAPAWFVSAADSTWITPVSNLLSSVGSSTYGGVANIINAYTGAAVDENYGEYILPANGGHADYAGNEVYRCTIRSATPTWYRLTDPSVPDTTAQSNTGTATYADGNPRSSHGWYKHVGGNGKVYIAPAVGVYNAGVNTMAVHKFDRASLGSSPGTLSAAQTQAAWTYIGQGITDAAALSGWNSNVSWDSGPCAYDSVTKRIWSAPVVNVNNSTQFAFYIDTLTDTIVRPASSRPGTLLEEADRLHWSAIASDLGVWIAGNPRSSKLFLMDLSNPTGFTVRTSTTGTFPTTGADSERPGMVYYKDTTGARYILWWHQTSGNTIRKCTVPASPLTATAADWVWSNYTTLGTAPPSNASMAGVHSKFNIMSMGTINGVTRYALICHTLYSGQTYVLKLPAVL
jgi:hypothetical protein